MAYTRETIHLDTIPQEMPVGQILVLGGVVLMSGLAIVEQCIVMGSIFEPRWLSIALGIIVGLLSQASLSVVMASRTELREAVRVSANTPGGKMLGLIICCSMALNAMEVQVLMAAGYSFTKAAVLAIGSQIPAATSITLVASKYLSAILDDDEYTWWFINYERLMLAQDEIVILATLELGVMKLRNRLRSDDQAIRMTNRTYQQLLALHMSIEAAIGTQAPEGRRADYITELQRMVNNLPFSIRVRQERARKMREAAEQKRRDDLKDVVGAWDD